MKVFGKKTMALVMAVAMMLSLCCVNVNAADAPESVSIDDGDSVTIGVGETVTLTATVSPSGASQRVKWSADKKEVASVGTSTGKVTGEKAGTATITATTRTGNKKDTITVTVKPITTVEVGTIEVGYGISKKDAITAIKAVEDATLNYDGGSYTGKYAGSVNWDLADDDVTFNSKDVGAEYEFAFSKSGVTGTATVKIVKANLAKAEDAVLTDIIADHNTKYSTVSKKFPTSVKLALNNGSSKTFTIGDDEDDEFEPWEGPEVEKFVLADGEKVTVYTYTAEFVGSDDYDTDEYDVTDLTQRVIVYDKEIDAITMNAGDEYVSLSSAVDTITAALNVVFGTEENAAEIDHIDITKITGYNEEKDKTNTSYISGTLYTDDSCETKVESGDKACSAEDFAKMYFVPNGKGHVTVLQYSVWADEAEKQVMKGEIRIESDTFMTLEMKVNNSDVLDFSSSAFSSAFKALDSDNTLVSVEFVNDLYASEGELYYKYNTKKEEVVSSSDELFVKADADEDEWDLDDVSFVPDKDAKGVIAIDFTAYGYYDGDKDDDVEADGILYITILDEADIVITAGVEEKVPVDLELFEEYLDDEADTEKIAYIVFDGAPYTTSSGYLISGTKSFKTSGDKTFHMDPDKDEYDLEDLYFMGGEDKGTKRADFEIYYYDGKTVEEEPVTGTVDFTTGVSTNIYTKSPLKAAEVLKFSSSISAFEKVGEQENEYFKFTSLPKGAKLYYNYGMSTQEDVKIGTEYYLGSASGKKLLKNITFVPSYSSDKQQQVISFDYKAYDSSDNYVAGACFFEVVYASKSAYFTDITTKTYADSVDFLKNQGITTGTTATTFGPNNNVTRGQFVTFLWRAAGSPTVTGVTNKFTDVKSTGDYAYAYQAILWAVKNNITTGRSATIFDPAANVTHQELLTFLYRYDVNYLKHSGAASTSVSYADFNSVADYAKTAVKWADNKGILDGNTIQPANAGIRATVALWMHRMLTL